MSGNTIHFLSFVSYAQKGYEKGFVVLNTKDTLYGFVKDRKTGSFEKLYEKIKFKGERRRAKYKPSQILEYKKGEFHFLKVVQKEFLTYYYWEFKAPDSGYIDTIRIF